MVGHSCRNALWVSGSVSAEFLWCPMNKPILVCIIALFASIVGSGQGPASESKIHSLRQSLNGVEQPYNTLYGHLITGVLDGRAKALLAGADAFTRKVFAAPGLEFVRAVSYRQGGDDLLTVEWTQKTPRIDVLLEDTPYRSIYYVHLPYRAISGGTGLTSLLSDVLVWRGPGLHLRPEEMEFGLFESGGTVQSFDGGAIFRSAAPNGLNIQMRGTTDKVTWQLSLNIPKTYTSGDYPVPPNIPERFPALTELMKDWSFERVWSEIGKPVRIPPYLRIDRDTLLATELLRRGVSEQQFSDLLTQVDPVELQQRALTVLQALSQTGQDQLLTQYLRGAVKEYTSRFPNHLDSAEDAAELLFTHGNMCGLKLESIASDALRDRALFLGPLVYLRHCGASESVASFVTTLEVPSQWAQLQANAVRDIRRRMLKNQKK